MPDTSAFDAPLDCHDKLYDDEVKGMLEGLPSLLQTCHELATTERGKNFQMLRLPIFVLASNKLEGTSSSVASEGETFKVLVESMHEKIAASFSPPLDDAEKHVITWDEEGQNSTNEAWYEQCKAHMGAVCLMEDWAKKGEPLTCEKLLECHKVMMKGAVTNDGRAFESRFRAFDESVMAGNYAFPNSIDLTGTMEAVLAKRMEEFYDTNINPIQWACSLMLDILTFHPFLNGNGRLARICFAYGLSRHGVPCMVVLTDDHSKARSHYIRAVQCAQGQKGDPSYKLINSMAVMGLYATLANMVNFCEPMRMK